MHRATGFRRGLCHWQLPDMRATMATFLARGLKASLEQLQTSSQLRIRRKGAKEYANLGYGAGGYSGAAARITMRELMECYRDEIYPEHKRWRH